MEARIDLSVQKVIVFGFSHCGTSILKSIIGHIPDVFEVIDEMDVISLRTANRVRDYNLKHPGQPYRYILIKTPQFKEKYLTELYWRDFIKIFIIRHPVYVYSSINKRTRYAPTAYHAVSKYAHAAMRFRYFLDHPDECRSFQLHLIKYEDLFKNNYSEFRQLLDNIEFKYDLSIFNNSDYKNSLFSGVHLEELADTPPSNTEHELYRTFQINQPFVNNNDPIKIDIKYAQLQELMMCSAICELYPDITQYIVYCRHFVEQEVAARQEENENKTAEETKEEGIKETCDVTGNNLSKESYLFGFFKFPCIRF
jgi:hypothetical protein